MGFGVDMAVAYLDDPVDDVAPLDLGHLREDMAGRRFIAVGYGSQNMAETKNGTRLAGAHVLHPATDTAL